MYEQREIEALRKELSAAKQDIAAMLWLYDACEYCAYAVMEKYSGAVRYRCAKQDGTGFGGECHPVWRGGARSE